METQSVDQPISAEEAEHHLVYVRRVIAAGSDDERREALVAHLLAFAHRALVVWREIVESAYDEQRQQFQDVFDELLALYVGWLKGQVLSDRPSEVERRANAGLLLLQSSYYRELHHYAALAILELPAQHERRDVSLVRQAVRDELEYLRAQGEARQWVSMAGALRVAYDNRFGSDDELLAWEAWVVEAAGHVEPESALLMWVGVEGFYVEHALADAERWLSEVTRVRAIIDALPMTPRMKAESYVAAARLLTRQEDQRPIAELYEQALATDSLGESVERLIAVKTARVHSSYGQWDRVIDLLAPRLASCERVYAAAIRDEDRDEHGEEHGECSALLAFALAHRERWAEAVETIERGKCVRQRRALALRETPGAAPLLEIEGELYALSRGLPSTMRSDAVEQVRDWLAQGLTPEAELRERYRQLLPAMADAVPGSPSYGEIGEALREGEAALSLGLWWTGLMAALVVRGGSAPAWTMLREDVTQGTLGEWLAGGEGENEAFLLALERGVAAVDPRPALERLLAQLDDAIGKPVAAAMHELGLSRLVVLPHHFLRVAPLWALESWRDLDVRMAPGAFAIGSASLPVVRGRALVVANPTLDLSLSTTEAAIAAERLSAAGLETRRLEGTAATEAALSAELEEATLLHFAGHGIASLTDGTMSSLLVSAVWSDTPFSNPQELLALPEDSPRLSVDREEGSSRRKLFYEYARHGTLYAEAEGEQPLLTGELWRTGDILVQGSLRSCALAFLCACSSGLGAIGSLEEASGLPAALTVAGVGCVIGTGWPVADEITVLFADELYARALPSSDGAVDVVRAVRGAAQALRTMAREEAAARVEAIAARAPNLGARMQLKAFARRLSKGEERPFAHPFHAGAFFVTGSAEIRLEGISQ